MKTPSQVKLARGGSDQMRQLERTVYNLLSYLQVVKHTLGCLIHHSCGFWCYKGLWVIFALVDNTSLIFLFVTPIKLFAQQVEFGWHHYFVLSSVPCLWWTHIYLYHFRNGITQQMNMNSFKVVKKCKDPVLCFCSSNRLCELDNIFFH